MSNIVQFRPRHNHIDKNKFDIYERMFIATALNLWGRIPVDRWTNPETCCLYEKDRILFCLEQAQKSKLFSSSVKEGIVQKLLIKLR